MEQLHKGFSDSTQRAGSDRLQKQKVCLVHEGSRKKSYFLNGSTIKQGPVKGLRLRKK